MMPIKWQTKNDPMVGCLSWTTPVALTDIVSAFALHAPETTPPPRR